MDWKPELDAIVGARHGGKTDHVLAALRALAVRHPHTAEIEAELAFTSESSGDYPAALTACERALALGIATPAEQANLLARHATCLLRLQRAPEAIVALEHARAQFPAHLEFTVFLALARHHAGQSQSACADLLSLLLDTSEDIGLAAHQRTLRSLLTL